MRKLQAQSRTPESPLSIAVGHFPPLCLQYLVSPGSPSIHHGSAHPLLQPQDLCKRLVSYLPARFSCIPGAQPLPSPAAPGLPGSPCPQVPRTQVVVVAGWGKGLSAAQIPVVGLRNPRGAGVGVQDPWWRRGSQRTWCAGTCVLVYSVGRVEGQFMGGLYPPMRRLLVSGSCMCVRSCGSPKPVSVCVCVRICLHSSRPRVRGACVLPSTCPGCSRQRGALPRQRVLHGCLRTCV